MATDAAKMRQLREEARSAGLCPVCRKTPPRSGLKTCRDCSESAKARIKRNRAKTAEKLLYPGDSKP